MNKTEIRENFPYLKTGKIYFDHAAVSPLPTTIKEKVDQYLYERSFTEINNYQSNLETISSLRENLAHLLNTASDRVAFTKSVTDGINILAQGIDWKNGDRIILNDMEFPANVYPFLNLKKYGVEVDFVNSKNGIIEIDDIEKLITPRTKLVSISFVQFLSGYKADLISIGEICKENGIIFCVDAIQGAGIMELDVQRMNIDFLAGGSHKWLMGLLGLGYLYISEELQNKIDQKNVGWLSVKDEWNLLDYKLDFKSGAERYHTGTFSAIAVIALNTSLEFFKSIGFINIQNNILENTQYFLNTLAELGINPVLQHVSKNSIAGIVTFPIDNSQLIFEKLVEKNIKGAVREGLLRFSPHFYNTKDEIDCLINELKEIKSKK